MGGRGTGRQPHRPAPAAPRAAHPLALRPSAAAVLRPPSAAGQCTGGGGSSRLAGSGIRARRCAQVLARAEAKAADPQLIHTHWCGRGMEEQLVPGPGGGDGGRPRAPRVGDMEHGVPPNRPHQERLQARPGRRLPGHSPRRESRPRSIGCQLLLVTTLPSAAHADAPGAAGRCGAGCAGDKGGGGGGEGDAWGDGRRRDRSVPCGGHRALIGRAPGPLARPGPPLRSARLLLSCPAGPCATLPFLDLPLPFHCLSLTFHCLFTAYRSSARLRHAISLSAGQRRPFAPPIIDPLPPSHCLSTRVVHGAGQRRPCSAETRRKEETLLNGIPAKSCSEATPRRRARRNDTAFP